MSTLVYKIEAATPGKSRNSARTRNAILAAATELFASRGYADTAVREIATLAGINSALVGRYFGPKDELFAAALEQALDIAPLLAGDRKCFGETAVRIFFDSDHLPSPLMMMIFAASDPVARSISAAILDRRVIRPLAEWLGGGDGELRAMHLNMLWSGFFTGWKLLPLKGFTGDNVQATKEWLIAATQAIVDRQPSDQ